jgi:RNA polymerase sigma-70 factor (ECF subfamily)
MWLIARRISTLRLAASFSAWIFALIRRECLRVARRVSFRDVPLDGLENDLSSSLREDTDLRLDLARAIGSLPSHYRRVITLRDIEELGVGEIATTENLWREAVKARLHRARSMVREYLEKENMGV